MNTEDILKAKVGHNHGFKTPDGFLEQVYTKISANLPEREFPKPKQVTTWHKLRPYIYMAAMFGGIWCTMKMVSVITERQQVGHVSFENPPAVVAKAISAPEVSEEVYEPLQTLDIELANASAASVESMSEFEEAFDYELSADVKNIDVGAIQQSMNVAGSSDEDLDDEFYEDYYAYDNI